MSDEHYERNRRLAALHVMAKDLGLDQEVYRDKLEIFTGQRSAAHCSIAELDLALDGFRRSGKGSGSAMSHVKHSGPVKQSGAANPYAAKIKAVWIALWNLGALSAGDDGALDAFVLRQTGMQRLQFVTAVESAAITEALKAIAARHGWQVPTADQGGMMGRARLVRAQWARLNELGAVTVNCDGTLISWAHKRALIECTKAVDHWKRHELDAASKKLGSWLRTMQKRAGVSHAA